MYDSFEYRGYWWIPDNPDRRVAGILTYSMEGINLELFDTLSPERGSIGMESNKFELIFGECEGNKIITLNDGFETKLRMSGIITTRLTFNKMLVGKHIASIEAMNFHSVSVNYSYIEEWMRHNPFEDNYELDEDARLNRVGTTYSFPPVFEIYVKSIEAKIKANYYFNTNGELYKTKVFQHVGALKIVPDENRALDWFLDNIRELQDLLSFLCNRSISPKYLELKGEIINTEKNIRENIDFYMLPMENYVEKKIHASEIFLDFKKIEGNIKEIVNNWFDDDIKSSKKIYLRNLYDSGADWETKFLNYAKAIESFHRQRSRDTSKFLSDEKYELIKKLMIEALPTDLEAGFKSKLEGTLAYAHHHGFERRVRETFKALDGSLREQIFGTNAKIREFAGFVTKSRDYYTHFGDRPDFLLKNWGLYFTNIRLHTVLFYQICNHLKVDKDVICQAIKEDYNLVQNLQIAKQELTN
jgi:hypothetical protein